jgi:tetratricopeptide (TPR) repeat protein
MTKFKMQFFFILAAIFFVSYAAMATTKVDEQAKKAYKEGISLFENQQYKEAADKFKEAYNAKATWKLLFNIAQSEAAAKNYGLALESFEQYLADGGDNVPDGKKELVLNEIQRLRLMVGILDVKASDGSRLFIDGNLRGTVPFKGIIRVAVGDHLIKVTYNDKTIYEKKLRIAGGMQTTINAIPDNELSAGAVKADGGQADAVKTEEAADEEAADNNKQSEETKSIENTSGNPPQTSKKGMPAKFKAGVITGSAGVVFMGLGIAFAIKGNVDSDKAEKLDPHNPNDINDLKHYNDDILPVNNALTATGFIVGGAAIATGAVLIILGVKEKRQNKLAIAPTFGGFKISF